MIDLRDIQPVTQFQRNMKHYVAKLKRSRNPLVLTVNGRAEIVVQDAVGYQQLLERLDRAEAAAAIRESDAEFAKGQGMPAREALAALRKRHGVPD